MPRSAPSWVLALVAVTALPACGEPCARLSKALCDGGEEAYCQQVDGWLQSRLIDPATKEPLVGEARDQMCDAIYGSVDVFNGYRFKAKTKFAGEPEFTLASSTPEANKAEPDKPADGKASAPRPETKAAPAVKPAADDDDDRPADNMSD